MDRKELRRAILQETDYFPGKAAFYYCDLNHDEERISSHASGRLVSASLIKVPIMLAVLDCAMCGHLSLDEIITVKKKKISPDTEVFEYGRASVTVYELLYWMISGSDNTSANLLVARLGRKKLNAYFKSIGLTKTMLNQKFPDLKTAKRGRGNYTSPKDIYRVMKGLCSGKFLDDAYGRTAMMLLHESRDDSMLRRYLCDGWYCAHKSGGVPGAAHDAGIFDTGSSQYFLGVFLTDFKPDRKTTAEARRLTGRISRIVAEYRKENAAQDIF